ncbi:MAG: hypothetical protein ACYDBQ_12275 [Thermoplasmatota archaeon]
MTAALDQLLQTRPDLRQLRREERVALLARELERLVADALHPHAP